MPVAHTVLNLHCRKAALFNKWVDQHVVEHINQADMDPKDAPALIDLLFISKSLERVGDHAVNKAMEAIYFLRGEDIRHTEKSKSG